jgi:hypothetical protein
MADNRSIRSAEDSTFRWSNFYRAFLGVIFALAFIDIPTQLILRNLAWTIVSVAFCLVIIVMIVFSYKRPFIKLSNGILKFYLLPIPPIAFQTIRLSEISDIQVENSSLRIILSNGRKARANLYAIESTDREILLEYLFNGIRTGWKIGKSPPL